MPLEFWSSPAAAPAALATAIVGAVVVTLFVDVSPKVEGEFFFADDDPQMQASQAVRERFPSGSQLILRVVDRAGDRAAYLSRIGELTGELLDVDGVEWLQRHDERSVGEPALRPPPPDARSQSDQYRLAGERDRAGAPLAAIGSRRRPIRVRGLRRRHFRCAGDRRDDPT